MNCSDAFEDAVAKYAFEIGLKPLKIDRISEQRITYFYLQKEFS